LIALYENSGIPRTHQEPKFGNRNSENPCVILSEAKDPCGCSLALDELPESFASFRITTNAVTTDN
jgi:hypothetical protein